MIEIIHRYAVISALCAVAFFAIGSLLAANWKTVKRHFWGCPVMLFFLLLAWHAGATKPKTSMRISADEVTAKAATFRVVCGEDLVGESAQVQMRLDATGSVWKTVDTYEIGSTNETRTVKGCYISGGVDRYFRVFVPASAAVLEVAE